MDGDDSGTERGIPATLEHLAVDIRTLRPYQRNPRNGDIEAIVESLRANGQYRPIVVRAGTGEILAGNHTYMAALELGWERIAATTVDVDDEQAARIVLVDNRTADLARYDDGLLAELLQSLPTLDGTGYDDAALTDLLARMGNGVLDFDAVGIDEQGRLDQKAMVICPNCHHEFSPS